MVLVIAGALDLDWLAVQEEAAVCVEVDGANSEGGVFGIDGLAVGLQCRDCAIEVRVLAGPERGLSDLRFQREGVLFARRNRGGCGDGGCNRLARWIDECDMDAAGDGR